jgi:hypothetical protein
MKVRGTTAGTPFGARLTALCWAALALLGPVAVSACTSGSSSTPTIIPTVTNSPTGTGTTSASSGTSASPGTSASAGSTSASGTPGVSSGAASGSEPPSPTVTVTVTAAAASPGSTSIPPAAPVTGGGGTAGFQGTLPLVLGVGAILAGAGGLAYRRWLGRRR